jgi:hypothetical protein
LETSLSPHPKEKKRIKNKFLGYHQTVSLHPHLVLSATVRSIEKSNVIIAATFSVIPHCGSSSISIIFRETIYGA